MFMKLFHLSDLHIGKRVNEYPMLEDQKWILDQILSYVDQEKPDGVIIAGDIYDKSVPPAEAVQVLDQFLTKLSDRHIKIFIISGNHDSPERLSFGSRLLWNQDIYIASMYEGELQAVRLQDSYGELWIHLLPFIRPSYVRHYYPEEAVATSSEAVRAVIAHAKIDWEQRNILVAHQFVAGAGLCDSEDIQAGGLDAVDPSVFDRFDYTALGHIHSPQDLGSQRIRYCGTPLKYSFSEAGQDKSVTVVELREKGNAEIRTLPLKPLRDMRKLKGTYMELTAAENYQGTNCRDYLHITLTDEEDILDGLQKLRVIYPNIMKMEYDNTRTREERQIQGADPIAEKTELELFEELYFLQNNQPMTEVQKAFVKGLIEEMKK